MSYFNSLNSFREAQQQIQQHSEDIEKQNQESKAQGIQEKFDYVDKVMGESAGGVAGLGGGFHIARRVYKKGLKMKKEAEDAVNKAKDIKEKLQGKKEEEPQGEEPQEEPKQEMSGSGEDVEGVEGKVKEFQQAEVKTQDVPQGGDAKPSEMTREAPEPPTEPKPIEEFPKAPEPPTEFDEQTGLRGGDNPRVGTNPSGEVSQQGAENDLNAKGTPVDDKAVGNEAKNTEVSDGMVDGAEQKAVSGGVKSTVKDAVNSGMEKLGVDDSIKAGVNTGLETAGEALDFLGPIGEIVGAGIAIVGFFRDIFEHKKLEREKQQAESGGAVAGESGISMSSIQQGGRQTTQIGTIV
tara:strand:+ start:1958 stop:3010 length:1053 start_codon:yes stop_codon:yes gene_type:complete